MSKILVVDDDDMIRMVLPEVIKMAVSQISNFPIDFEILLAKNGAEGLELFKQGQDLIKVIFTDFEMPVMNGKKMTELIREFEKEKSVTIIGLTGYDSDESRAEGIAAGMTKVLVKPP
jgi:CheY-like chemotaxis protein